MATHLSHASPGRPVTFLKREILGTLMSRVVFIDEGLIEMGTWMKARQLCVETDENDTPFVALTLHLKGRLWSNDQELKQGLRARGFVQFFEPTA